MGRTVCIIHESPVVREGLASIIRRLFKNDLYVYEGLESMHFNPKDAVIVLSSKVLQQFQKEQVYLDEKRITPVLLLGDGERPQGKSEYFIGLADSEAHIQQVLMKFLEPEESKSVASAEELTKREQDVLKLVAQGSSNKDIAEKLFISIHTVITHRKNITEKLGIKSISGLTVYAMINKLIVPDQSSLKELS